MYWDSTGDWRLTYYSELAKRDVNTLSIIEKAELELDILEMYKTESILKCRSKGLFLDIGCGVGRQILELSRKWNGMKFWGIDISPYQIKILNSIVYEKSIDNVYGIVMDAAHVGDLKNRFDIVTFYNNSFGCLSSIQQIECLNTLNSIIVPDGILLISCFERLDLIKQSYSEWGFPHAIIDYSTGIADLGEYKSNWKTKDIFLPFFARNSEFSLEDSDESGLGTVYIFRKKGRR